MQYSAKPKYTENQVTASSWTFNATGTVRNELARRNLGLQNDSSGNTTPVR